MTTIHVRRSSISHASLEALRALALLYCGLRAMGYTPRQARLHMA